jgi:hypothetical protein
MKKQNWLIQPYNEGQELNYSEIFTGTYADAKKIAHIMEIRLKQALKYGTITVEVEKI